MSRGRISSASESLNEIATLRIELKDTNPLIWRQLEVPTSITLKVLHDIIQIAIGWFDYHLWEFTIGEQKYGLPMDEDWGTEPRKQAAKVRLRDVLKARRTIIDYVYVYDFGDYWEHRITVTNVRAGDPEIAYPRYIGGERAGPPEDCGGTPGFYDLLAARGRAAAAAAAPPPPSFGCLCLRHAPCSLLGWPRAVDSSSTGVEVASWGTLMPGCAAGCTEIIAPVRRSSGPFCVHRSSARVP